MIYLLFSLVAGNLRFGDKEQLEKHHKHFPLVNESLTVHLIPHSHDDVGWLKTVDQYFNGLRNDIQWAGVEYIIDSYIQALSKDPTKTFIQVETAFFKMWWDKQNEETKTLTKNLVAKGQLEFISGGWCMNDEATPYYEDIIDQMTLGHKFLLDTFGVTPQVGWQIDPFGHQSTWISYSNQMGFNGWFIGRIDYQDKEKRMNEKSLEMIVIPPTKGVEFPLFSHVNYYHYSAPPGFDFDASQRTEPIVEDPNSDNYNLEAKVQQFVDYFRAQSTHYQGNHLIHTLGEDFQWSNAAIFYKNIDKLINYVNARPQFNMKIMYSTPSAYFKAVNDQNLTYPVKRDDFFPYADRGHSYWTGYFTSRVAYKGYVRYFGRQAQTYKKLITYFQLQNSTYINGNKAAVYSAIQKMNEELGCAQHHDAVAGTARQAVNDDYTLQLVRAERKIRAVVNSLLNEQLKVNTTFEYCNWNVSAGLCAGAQALKNGKTLVITIVDLKLYQAGQVDKIRVKVPKLDLRVVDQNGNPVYGDIICGTGSNDCDLYFLYTIPANNGILTFNISASAPYTATTFTLNAMTYTDDTSISLNGSQSFKLKYSYYESYQESDQPSGAYIFRSINGSDVTKQYGSVISASVGYGKNLSVIVIVRSYTKTIIRKFSHQADTYEIESQLDSIPVGDQQGKEVVIQIDTNIDNQNTFYTDSNGLDLQKRVLNYRPTWDLVVDEKASGNYYPFNGVILLNDSTQAAALINDRSQGATSLRKGQIEVMIHRRMLKDDYRGVVEPLNEQDQFKQGLIQNFIHILTFFNPKLSPNKHREIQYYLDLQPLILYSNDIKPTNIDVNWNIFDFTLFNDQGQKKGLPKVTVSEWNTNQYLLRVNNLQETGTLSIITGQLYTYTETTLTGNQPLSEWRQKQLKWKQLTQVQADDSIIHPLQTRTYIVSKRVQEDSDSIIHPLQTRTYIVSKRVQEDSEQIN